MSTPEPTPQAAGEAAAAAAAQRGATPDEVRQIVAEAMVSANERSGSVELTDDQLDQIGERIVSRFEARGAFDPPDAAPGAVDTDVPPAPTPGGGAPEPTPATPVDVAPRKKTWAEKFVGRTD